MEPWSRYQRDSAPFWRARETVCFLAFCGFWELLPFLCSWLPLGIFKTSSVVPSALLLPSHRLSLCISFFQLQGVFVGPCRYAGVNSLMSVSRALAADIFGWRQCFVYCILLPGSFLFVVLYSRSLSHSHSPFPLFKGLLLLKSELLCFEAGVLCEALAVQELAL